MTKKHHYWHYASDQNMNHIHRLQKELRDANAVERAYRQGLAELLAHLTSSKFNHGDRLDGYISITDVARRINEIIGEANNANNS